MTELRAPQTTTDDLSFKPYRKWGTVVGVGIGFCGYVLGWPMWQVLVLSFAIPSTSLVTWLMTSPEFIRRYRFLFVIYGLAAFPAAYELWATKTLQEPVTEFLNIDAGPGEADLLFHYDFPRFLGELFPNRSETLFARGYQMQMCVSFRREGTPIPICERLENVSMEQAGRYLKAAVDTGNRTEENVLHYYAVFLSQTGAPENEVEAAFAEWKRHYPFSNRTDPRRPPTAAAEP